MAYFSNGEEGRIYHEQWCLKCLHWQGLDDLHICPVWDLHVTYNRDGANNKEHFLHRLIPMKDGYATKCEMFISTNPAEWPEELRVQEIL